MYPRRTLVEIIIASCLIIAFVSVIGYFRSVKIEENKITTWGVPIETTIEINSQQTKVLIHTPGYKPPPPKIFKPDPRIDWENKPKVFGGLGVEITGREAMELIK